MLVLLHFFSLAAGQIKTSRLVFIVSILTVVAVDYLNGAVLRYC